MYFTVVLCNNICFFQRLTVACYPERVIADVEEQIARLEKEYKAFSRKLRELDPEYAQESATNPRTYSVAKKRTHDQSVG